MRGAHVLECFAGAGGGVLSSILLGQRTFAAIEADSFCCDVLQQRQADGVLPTFPVWRGDIRNVDGRPLASYIDEIHGGFPCVDIAACGSGDGLSGERSSLWFEMFRLVQEIKPRVVFAENSPLLRSRGLGTLIRQLDGMGYVVRWGVLGGWHLGAPHRRNRMWVYAAHPDIKAIRFKRGRAVGGSAQVQSGTMRHVGNVADADGARRQKQRRTKPTQTKQQTFERLRSWPIESGVGRVVPHGVAGRLDRSHRLRSIGNGQIPSVAAVAYRVLSGAVE
jgi:DNA (cytosine-5)-methyltransferase 1